MAADLGTIGEAFVEVRARLGKLESDLTKARKASTKAADEMDRPFKRLRKTLGSVKAGYALVAVGALAAGVAFAKARQSFDATIDALDSVDKASRRLGVSAQALQEWRFAAELAGVSSQTFDNSLRVLVRVSEEATKGLGEGGNALRSLGLSMKEVAGLNPEQLFSRVIRELGKIEDAGERLRIAVKLFESEGAGLVVLAGDFDELAKRAREAGVAIDDGTIRAAVEAKDKLAELSAVTSTRLAPSLVQIAPIFVALGESLLGAATGAESLFRKFRQLLEIKAFGIEEQIADADVKLVSLNERMGFFVGLLGNVPKGSEEFVNTKDQIVRLQMEIEKTSDSIVKLRQERDALADTGSDRPGGGSLTAGVKAQEEALARLESLFDSVRTPGEKLRIVLKGLSDDLKVGAIDSEQYIAGVNAIGVAFADLEAQSPGQQLLAEVLNAAKEPAEELKEKIEELNAALGRGEITTFEYGEAVNAIGVQFEALADTAEDAGSKITDVAERGAGDFGSLFSGILIGSEDAGQAFERFAARAVESLASVVFEALATRAALAALNLIPGINVGVALAGREHGGPVSLGQPFIVGEKGPELFVPRSAGVIVPTSPTLSAPSFNAATRSESGQLDITLNLINHGPPIEASSPRQTASPGQGVSFELILKAMINRQIGEGSFDQSLGRSFGLQRTGRF